MYRLLVLMFVAIACFSLAVCASANEDDGSGGSVGGFGSGRVRGRLSDARTNVRSWFDRSEGSAGGVFGHGGLFGFGLLRSYGSAGGHGSSGSASTESGCDNPNCQCENCQCGADCECGASSVPAKEAAPTSPAEDSSADCSQSESQMIAAINRYRDARNLPPLAVDTTLMRLARMRVGVFEHQHPRYGWMHQHARRFGYIATDNLAKGFGGPFSPGEAVDGWATSSVGHNLQMLGQIKENGRWKDMHFDRVGVAQHGLTYIAVFGKQG